MNKFKSILLSGLIVFAVAACGTNTPNEPDSSTPGGYGDMESTVPETNQTFTLDELSQYNGKDGNPAYVAVDGVVYDVSDVEPWANGEHKNGITAGNELSDEILNSPHGKGVLKDLPVIGTLKEE